MKFIHCADLHLDAVMESGMPPRQAAERRSELLRAFSSLAELAKGEGVRAVIIAGDLFDRCNVSARARNYFLDTVKATPEVDFLLLRGNHDSRVLTGCDLPANLRLFGKEWTSFDYGEAVITGAEAPDEGSLSLDGSRLNIVVLHGADRQEFSLSALAGKGIDYLALGHFHSFSSGRLDARGEWCYAGCPEGRGFDECGEKGFVLLDISDGKLTRTFIPSAARQVVSVDADMTDAVSLTLQREAIEAALSGVDRKNIVRVNITGSFEPGREKYYRSITDGLASDFFYLELTDSSKMRIEASDYADDISLKGEFIRLVTENVADEETRGRIITFGIRALRGEELT